MGWRERFGLSWLTCDGEGRDLWKEERDGRYKYGRWNMNDFCLSWANLAPILTAFLGGYLPSSQQDKYLCPSYAWPSLSPQWTWLVPRILPPFHFLFHAAACDTSSTFPSFLMVYSITLQRNSGRVFMTRNINLYGSANPLMNFIPRSTAWERCTERRRKMREDTVGIHMTGELFLTKETKDFFYWNWRLTLTLNQITALIFMVP